MLKRIVTMNPAAVFCLLLAISSTSCKTIPLEDVQPQPVQELHEDIQPLEDVQPLQVPETPVSDRLVEGIAVEEAVQVQGSRQARKRVASLNDALRCGFDVPCFLENMHAVLEDRKQIMLAEADARYMSSSLARSQSNEPPSELAQTVEGIINKMTDIVKDTVSSWLKEVKIDELNEEKNEAETAEQEEEKEDENQEVTEEGRGKKKKKLKSLMKLLILGAVLKAKLTVLLQLLSAALQIKFFFIALTGLLINKIRLWYDLKKGHHPQKVIYYEHAQHQHHYDHLEDDHHGGGGFWGRAYEVPEEEEQGQGLSSQEMAYRGQRPIPWSPQHQQ